MPIALILALIAAQPSTPTPSPPTPPASTPPTSQPEQTPEQTLAGLQDLYATSCGQTGIIYHAYDDLCDGLRRQIHDYEVRIDREAAAARARKLSPTPAAEHRAPPRSASTQ